MPKLENMLEKVKADDNRIQSLANNNSNSSNNNNNNMSSSSSNAIISQHASIATNSLAVVNNNNNNNNTSSSKSSSSPTVVTTNSNCGSGSSNSNKDSKPGGASTSRVKNSNCNAETVDSSMAINNSNARDLQSQESVDTVNQSTSCLSGAVLDLNDGRHRRSLSENGLLFPHNTKPSDKARCHILRGCTIRENIPTGSAEHQQPPQQMLHHPLDGKNSPRVTFRKIAETMFLKDPQYKQQMEVPKRNPFTALAQLKGVKKIICGTGHTTGLSNLFSSCFEMSSASTLKGANGGAAGEGQANGDQTPKSLPNSPIRGRKEYGMIKVEKLGAGVVEVEDAMEEGLRLTGTLKKVKANSLFAHPLFKHGGAAHESEEVPGEGHEDGADGKSQLRTTGIQKSFSEPAANDLAARGEEEEESQERGKSETTTTSGSLSVNTTTTAKSESNETICNNGAENVKLLNRRGSTESGFFSCLNEDFGRQMMTPPCCCCSALESLSAGNAYGRSTLFLGGPGGGGGGGGSGGQMRQGGGGGDLEFNSSQTLNDSSGLLMFDDATSMNRSFRSIDDLDLSNGGGSASGGSSGGGGGGGGGRRVPFYCSRHGMDGLGGGVGGNRSNSNNLLCNVDMDLINRLALDSEINHIMQQNQMSTNHLLFYKNRTSSIYTDSSDDISSLAGSDSLLWDSPRGVYSSAIPNTRSAQIAKIVEYFERKGQTFKAPSFAAAAAVVPGQQSQLPHHHHQMTMADFNRNLDTFDHSTFYQRAGVGSGLRGRDYEAFCLDLDKRPTQQRLLICEGAVRSKLPLFDKQKPTAVASGGQGQAQSPTGAEVGASGGVSGTGTGSVAGADGKTMN